MHILAEVEQCQRGEMGALLRREGLYSSMLSKWREQKAAGKLDRPSVSQEQKGEDQTKELKRPCDTKTRTDYSRGGMTPQW